MFIIEKYYLFIFNYTQIMIYIFNDQSYPMFLNLKNVI